MAREERKTEILKAAGRVFYYKGFEGTKIEDVAREAGIGKGTVYEYFDSKQQLFNEMVSYNRELYIHKVMEALDSGHNFREKFIALAKFQTQLVKEHMSVFDSMACSKIMAREMGALILEQNIRIGEILIAVALEAMAKGELRNGLDPEIVASLVFGTINQYCGKKVLFYNSQPDDLDYEKIVDTVLTGIGNP